MKKTTINFDQFYNALISGNKELCSAIISAFLSKNTDISTLYEHLFKPSLYKVGYEWEQQRLNVAVEHMATSIVEDLMNELLPGMVSLQRKGRNVVLSSVENEEHQLGCRMVADTFEKHGWDTFFTGAKTPITDLITFCETIKPHLICLSLSITSNMPVLLHEIKTIRNHTDVTILIGGQGLIESGKVISEHFNNVVYLKDVFEVEELITETENDNSKRG
ncbi:cobalamin B12-binding domain-containing protein [Chitinispirillales bacterium ANBcel5]|uniref:cobalamin B12-binding domain-containing protein n=1 Tax=Cellulosispirillum alkaliphilum TaxID=3039283 RepID=UPI002A54787C|nr:cobalamin B12-binding domain-containing protein [Chitinispirillales bacterium ANBcel5]